MACPNGCCIFELQGCANSVWNAWIRLSNIIFSLAMCLMWKETRAHFDDFSGTIWKEKGIIKRVTSRKKKGKKETSLMWKESSSSATFDICYKSLNKRKTLARKSNYDSTRACSRRKLARALLYVNQLIYMSPVTLFFFFICFHFYRLLVGILFRFSNVEFDEWKNRVFITSELFF